VFGNPAIIKYRQKHKR